LVARPSPAIIFLIVPGVVFKTSSPDWAKQRIITPCAWPTLMAVLALVAKISFQ